FPKIAPGTGWAITAPFSIFIGYTLACILIRWTVREALRPALVIVVVNALVITFDLIFTIKKSDERILAIICLALASFAIVPGLLICWWRFSRFRKKFRINFEISGYRKLQRELDGARRLHESTLPPRNLLSTGPICLSYVYEPMRQIGGDILY